MHLSHPGPDNGTFTTLEVRPRQKPTSITSRAISFPRNHYTAPPNVAGGFHLLDLSWKAPAVRANLVGSDISKEGFVVGIETWDRGVLWEAGATWIEHKRGGRECGFGQFDTRDVDGDDGGAVEREEDGNEGEVKAGPRKLRVNGNKSNAEESNGQTNGNGIDTSYPSHPRRKQRQQFSKRIKFPSKLRKTISANTSSTSAPEVVCWLNRLDLPNSNPNHSSENLKQHHHYRLKAYATEITPEAATFHLDTWDDSVLNGAAMCWIAFPRNKKKVDSGTFSTSDLVFGNGLSGERDARPRQRNHKRVTFRKGWFEKPPTVLCALNMFDIGGEADLRIKVEVEDVDKHGFTWRLDTWDDSTLYAAGASWIALGFE